MAIDSRAAQVALYARVSTERQEKEATIDSQIAELRTKAAREGWDVVEMYQDNGYTGSTLARPALDRLRQDARAGRFGRVLFHTQDRIARKRLLQQIVLDELDTLNIPVAYCTYQVDDSAEGRLMDNVLGSFAEYEREKILDRTRRGKEYKAAQGHLWRGLAPYGWRYLPPSGEKHGRMEILPEEASVVRDVFDWIAAGQTAHWVAAELNSRGLRTRKGHPWTLGTVARMVHNPIHTGVVPTNRYESREPVKPRSLYRRRRKSYGVERPRSEWKTVQIEGIVSVEQWQAAEATLTRNTRFARRNAKADYLLAGLLHCGTPHEEQADQPCGRVLQGHQGTSTWSRVYRCSRYYQTPRLHVCKNRVPAEAIEQVVWGQLKALLQQPEILLQQMHEAEETERAARQGYEGALEQATHTLEVAQGKLDRLLAKNLEGNLDDTTFNRLQGTLIAERDAARKEVMAARQLVATEHLPPRWDDLRAYCADVSKALVDLEKPEYADRRQDLVRTLFTDIVIYPDRIVMKGVLPAASRNAIALQTSVDWPRPGGNESRAFAHPRPSAVSPVPERP